MPDILHLALPLSPWAPCALLPLFGLMLGSFANVVIFRLPRPACNLCFPNSFCPACRTPLRWFDNVPLLSYLALRGRCRCCKAPIPVRYPTVELLGALAGGLAAWRYGPTVAGLIVCVVLIGLVAAAWIDAEHRRLPHDLTWVLLGMGAFANMFGMLVSPLDAIVGCVLGYGLFWSAFWVHGLLAGRAALGEGDFRLLAAIGASLGWRAIPVAVLVAMAAAVVYALCMQWRARRHGGTWRCTTTFPFGPFLALGAWSAVACRPYLSDMIQWASVWASA